VRNNQVALIAAILWVIGTTYLRILVRQQIDENLVSELNTWLGLFQNHLDGRSELWNPKR